ncbi:MAG TPA: GNAT family N-acetyltransferase [Pyrinomonadaceae bacterium]
MTISRRPATIADTDFARSVHHRAYRDVIERQYGPWDESTQDKLFADAWSAADHEIVLWVDVRCGYTSIESRDDCFYLHELVIDPDFQGRGIGTHILRDVIEQAILKEVPVRLRTHIINRAVNLYRSLGFEETARTGSHVLMEWNHKAMRSIPRRDHTENLFSYGTLQSEEVQLATFGRRLEGKADRLIGYRINMIPISHHQLMATTGEPHHRNIQSTGAASDVVEGTVFTVKTRELEQADEYESTADYERVLVRLESQTNAWVYLHSDR